MSRFASKIFVLVVLVALGTLHVPMARGQGGLTDEEMVLLDRVLALKDITDSFSSYNSEGELNSTVLLTFSMGESEIVVTQSSTVTTQSTVINSDPRNILTEATAEFSGMQVGLGESETTLYTMEAEIRDVEDVLYVNAEYLSREGEVDEVPTGWVEVTAEDEFAAFAILDLESYLDEEESDRLSAFPLFDDRELAARLVSSITVFPDTLDDGTEVEVITMAVSGVDIFEALGDTFELGASWDMEALIALTDPDSLFAISVYFDGEGNFVGATMLITLSFTGDDAAAVIGDSRFPEGTGFTMTLVNSQTNYVRDVNAELEPTVAPEIE